MQRLQSGTADVVDGNSRNGIRQPAADRRLTRRILSGSCRQHLAEDHLINTLRIDAAALNKRLHHHAAQLHRRMTRQRALKTADWRSQRADDYDIFHPLPLLRLCAKKQHHSSELLSKIFAIV